MAWLVAALGLVSLLNACGAPGRYQPPPPFPADNLPIPEPKERDINVASDGFDMQVAEQFDEFLDLSRHFRKLFGKRKQAFNVNAFGEVDNSSWFTNRNALQPLSLEEIAKGPDQGDGPDMSSPWLVVRAKMQGVTPGFQIEDGRGNRYVIKFDPPGYMELVTGAEVVSTKLFYAVGYNVPENYMVCFDPKNLRLKANVKFTDEKGRKRFMTEADLQAILDRVACSPDGEIRALASKYLSGKPLGPFEYKSTRKDDPNDIIPHHHRRELRGFRVISAWLGHFDTKSANSLDMYITENGRSFVKHYLIDFGSTLGAGARGPVCPQNGFENFFDPHQISINLAFGAIYVPPHMRAGKIPYVSIGRFRSDDFQPQKYKFYIPNPAFENLTGNDGFWGAKIVMSFTDDQLETAVAQGKYSNPEAAGYLLQMLKERRDIVGRYWFGRMNPLDRFELQGSDGSSKTSLNFSDLAVETGLASAAGTVYRYDLWINGEQVHKGRELGNRPVISLPSAAEIREQRRPAGPGSPDYLELRIQTSRRPDSGWSNSVKMFLDFKHPEGKYLIRGLEREE